MQRGVTNIGNSRSSNSIKSSLMVFEDRLLPMWVNQSVTYVGELDPPLHLCIFAFFYFKQACQPKSYFQDKRKDAKMQRGVTNIGNSRSSNSIKSSLMLFEDRLLPMWVNQSVTYVGELPPPLHLCIFAFFYFKQACQPKSYFQDKRKDAKMQRGVTNIGNSRSSNSIREDLMLFEDATVTYVGESKCYLCW